eukprot:362856-Hanusia_phi.AAC.1
MKPEGKYVRNQETQVQRPSPARSAGPQAPCTLTSAREQAAAGVEDNLIVVKTLITDPAKFRPQ